MFRELAVSYLGRNDLAHVDPREIVGETGLGSSDEALEDENPPAMPAARFVSKGLTRGIQPNVFLVRGSNALAAEAVAEAVADGVPRAALKTLRNLETEYGTTVASATTVTTETTTRTTATAVEALAPLGRPEVQAVAVSATLTTAELRREARVKGYEGDQCGECGNFTLVRNGTCLKCDTCGGTSGCS
jgi:ribonucleoside-diphosphate reductase alpha chain